VVCEDMSDQESGVFNILDTVFQHIKAFCGLYYIQFVYREIEQNFTYLLTYLLTSDIF
jgi:hypothetical protein